MNSLKGVSAGLLRQEFTDAMNEAIMHGHLWSPSYPPPQVEGPLVIIRQYIQQQRRPA